MSLAKTDDRTTYTTATIRAEDLSTGDVAKLDGTWVWIRDCFSRFNYLDISRARDEYEHLPAILRSIDSITGSDGGMDCPVFVAVVYLHTPVSHTHDHHAYSAGKPEFRVSALSMYDLVEIQVPIHKED